MMNKLILGIAVILAGHTGMASASGFYVAAKAGATQVRSTENTLSSSMLAGGLNNTVGEIDVPSANRTNFTPSFAMGYEFSTDWEQPVRPELAYLAGGEVSQNSTLNTTMTSGWVDSGKFIQNLPVSVQRQQKTRVSTLMLNGYYDYTTGTPFTPYITGGVGVALLKNAASLSQSSAGLSFSSDTFSQNNTQMAWSLGAGVAWALTPALSLDAGYLFTNAGDVTTEGTASNGIITSTWKSHTHLQLHTLQLGLRYTF